MPKHTLHIFTAVLLTMAIPLIAVGQPSPVVPNQGPTPQTTTPTAPTPVMPSPVAPNPGSNIRIQPIQPAQPAQPALPAVPAQPAQSAWPSQPNIRIQTPPSASNPTPQPTAPSVPSTTPPAHVPQPFPTPSFPTHRPPIVVEQPIVINPVQPVPVPIGQPFYPAPTAGPLIINSFPDDGRVREGYSSLVFTTETWRPVHSIEVEWTDRGDNARGILIVNGESRSRWRAEDVNSPGQVTWIVNDHINSFHIVALDDDLFLRRVTVTYGASTSQGWGGNSSVQEFNFASNPLRISENQTSSIFQTDPSRRISQIEMAWGDRGRERARGRLLLIQGNDTESFDRQNVDGEGEVVVWNVNDRADGFRIRADRDDLYLFWIRVHYAGGPGWNAGSPQGGSDLVLWRAASGTSMQIPEGHFSQVFQTPNSWQSVRAIRVRWSDDGRNARGSLFINGETRSRFPPEGVQSPGEVRWMVQDHVSTLRILAEEDPIWIEEITLEYN